MNKLTPQELNERIADIPNECFESYPAGYYDYEEHRKMVKKLLRDFAEAITPELNPKAWTSTDAQASYLIGQESVVKTIQSNTRELLGD